MGSAAYVINLPSAATPTFTPVAGTYSAAQSVTINDTAPTGDRYDLSIVEVLPSLTGGGGVAPAINISVSASTVDSAARIAR